jgi:putative spermidine/putrescine transport system substrate-binding protein
MAPTSFAAAKPANNPRAGEILKGSGEVIISTWGGVFTDLNRQFYFDPFEKATGIKVVTTGVPDLAKMRLMAQSGKVEWDLVAAEGQMMRNAAKGGILQPIDYDLIFKVVSRDDINTSDLHEFGFPSIALGYTLCWNTKTVKNPPQNWADFWNTEKFAGRRAVYARAKPFLEAALLADGVAKKDLYPLDVDRAFKKIDQIKKHVNVWVESTAQFDVLMQNGEVDYLLATQGRATQSRDKGFPVDYTFTDGFWEQSTFAVMKNSPNTANAQKLLAWIAQPEGQAKLAAAWACGVSNKRAYELMSPEAVAQLPTAPVNLPKMVKIDTDWWTANNDAVTRRWLAWVAAR